VLPRLWEKGEKKKNSNGQGAKCETSEISGTSGTGHDLRNK